MLSKLRCVVQLAQINSISCDEVIAMDNTSWIEVHVYAIKRWKRMPHLLHLLYVFDVEIASNLTIVIMDALINDDLITDDIVRKVICFWANGVNTFERHKKGVTIKFVRSKLLLVLELSSH